LPLQKTKGMHVGRNLVTCIPVGHGDGGAIFAKLNISDRFSWASRINGLPVA
jgi:hypothetical protein